MSLKDDNGAILFQEMLTKWSYIYELFDGKKTFNTICLENELVNN